MVAGFNQYRSRGRMELLLRRTVGAKRLRAPTIAAHSMNLTLCQVSCRFLRLPKIASTSASRDAIRFAKSTSRSRRKKSQTRTGKSQRFTAVVHPIAFRNGPFVQFHFSQNELPTKQLKHRSRAPESFSTNHGLDMITQQVQ
jgi:hypothetical protein